MNSREEPVKLITAKLLNSMMVYEDMSHEEENEQKTGHGEVERTHYETKIEHGHKNIVPQEWFQAKKWKENPFTFNIYPYLFVGYKEQANRVLLMLLEKHKFILLSGPTGSGKTTLLRWAENNLGNGYDALYIGKPPEKPEDFVLIFNEKYKSKWPFRKKLENIYQIPEFLNKKLKRKQLVLMLDEAHEASIETLEWLRVLGDQVNNVSFLLAGLPVFEEQLMDKLETFRKRIIAKIDLSSLTKEETEKMIKMRIQNVGGHGNEFSKELMDFIHERAGGFPREVLRLCNELVTNAILQGKTEITQELLEGIEIKEERVSMAILDTFTPMQREIIEILAQKSLPPGHIADSLDLQKYKSRQHAVRSVNNILKMLLAQDYVERKQSEKTFIYSLTTKIKPLLVKA